MKTLRYTLCTLLIAMSVAGHAQDTIRMTNGSVIVGKVLEIDHASVKYKKMNNPEGPSYILQISEIHSIRYQNNEIELYAPSGQSKPDRFLGMNKDEILKEITRKGNKVFIESKDESAILHATHAIKVWGYWKITETKSEADFILRFNYTHNGLGDAFGKVLFVNPENQEVLYETKEVNTMMSADMNTKRAVINKLVTKEIRPRYQN